MGAIQYYYLIKAMKRYLIFFVFIVFFPHSLLSIDISTYNELFEEIEYIYNLASIQDIGEILHGRGWRPSQIKGGLKNYTIISTRIFQHDNMYITRCFYRQNDLTKEYDFLFRFFEKENHEITRERVEHKDVISFCEAFYSRFNAPALENDLSFWDYLSKNYNQHSLTAFWNKTNGSLILWSKSLQIDRSILHMWTILQIKDGRSEMPELVYLKLNPQKERFGSNPTYYESQMKSLLLIIDLYAREVLTASYSTFARIESISDVEIVSVGGNKEERIKVGLLLNRIDGTFTLNFDTVEGKSEILGEFERYNPEEDKIF